MLIAHKIALDLNDKQATYMARAAGCARFAYNWALADQFTIDREGGALRKRQGSCGRPARRRSLSACCTYCFGTFPECAPEKRGH